MTNKTIELIKNKFIKYNCELLDTDFKNKDRNSELKFICSCGKIGFGNWSVFRKKAARIRCKKCMGFYTQDEAEKIFSAHGCELCDVFKNVVSKMKYICKCGQVSYSTLSAFNKGHTQCKQCSNKQISKSHSHTYEYVFEYFNSRGFKLLSKNYSLNNRPLYYICVCGRLARSTFSHIQQGGKCKQCANDKLSLLFSKENGFNWNSDRDYIKLQSATSSRARVMVRNMIRKIQNNNSNIKKNRKHKILGYSANDLMYRLASCDNWNVVKNQDWTIDHIFPIKAFVENGITAMRAINALDNLQPLLHSDNSRKKDQYDVLEFYSYLRKKYMDGQINLKTSNVEDYLLYSMLLCMKPI